MILKVTGLKKHFYLNHLKSKTVAVLFKTEFEKLCVFYEITLTQVIIFNHQRFELRK